ncbi:MAG: MmcQ/YjbR family DNA-binding protein [Candidatus Saccharibacteria bacterium]|nr:MmcQ/YjbR family DNA-binding protein [Candidatus Saccharibacteria bacterium]
MDHKTVEEYLLSMPNTKLDYPFGEEVAVYKVFVPSGGADVDVAQGEWKMFALVAEGKDPVRLSLKCDPQLAKLLREKYETVLEGYHLNKKHWNTIILSGQLPWEEIQGFIRHSYDLVTKAGTEIPKI